MTSPDQLNFTLSGLSCAGCVRRAETALSAIPGVTAAQVNLATGKARLQAPHSVSLSDVTGALAPLGYGATIPAPTAQGDGEEGPRLLRRATLLAGLLTLPVFLVEMGSHLSPGFHHWLMTWLDPQANRVGQFVLITSVLLGPGRVFFAKGLPALLRGAPEMNALVALGTGAAWGYSSVSTFAPGLLPPGQAHVYFEAAGVIITLILLGRWLEARAKGQTGAAIRRLMDLTPETALRLGGDGPQVVPVGALARGDSILIKPGARVPADGQVTDGTSAIDEAMLTGEPIPVTKAPGDHVTGGTINIDGALTIDVTRVGAETTLAQIVAMVEEAQGDKLPIRALVDRVTAVFVPVVLGISALTFVAWMMLGPGLGAALVAAVGVLIIACPCAMGLATPMSILVGTGRAAELGVLFRQGSALQALAGAKVVAFDKTGTLTMGKPVLKEIRPAKGFDREDILRLVAAVEAPSEHPIANAFVAAYQGSLPSVDGFACETGAGISGTVAGTQVMVGSQDYLAKAGIETHSLSDGADLSKLGHTVLFAALNNAPAAMLAVADQIKPGTRPALDALRAKGVEIAMITGDAAPTAIAIAAELGITRITADVRPEGKLRAIKDLKALGPVAFVGDGLNDAPALVEADIGVAIGSGTDVAIDAADVVLMSKTLAGVVTARMLSLATLRNIRQNLIWAFGYNTLLIPVAAGVFAANLGWVLSPMLGAGAMAASSVLVVSNALRLRRIKGAVS